MAIWINYRDTYHEEGGNEEVRHLDLGRGGRGGPIMIRVRIKLRTKCLFQTTVKKFIGQGFQGNRVIRLAT